METQAKISKSEFWQSHLKGFALSGKSKTQYCRDENLSVHTFNYWYKRRERFLTSKGLAAKIQKNGFIQARVDEPMKLVPPMESSSILDAKWIADFVRHLHGRLS